MVLGEEKGALQLGRDDEVTLIMHASSDILGLGLQEGEWKKNDMFFEYRLKEGEALRFSFLPPFRPTCMSTVLGTWPCLTIHVTCTCLCQGKQDGDGDGDGGGGGDE